MTQGENKRLKKPFEGEVFVFTGTMKMERDEATMKVIELGGRCTKALSGKTTCLVTGDEPGPSKVKKAEKLGIRVEDEEQFMRRLHTAMGKLETKIEPEKDAYASIEKIEIGVNEESEFDFSIKSETGAETKQAEFVNWAEKYRPQKSSEIIGNPTAIGEVRDFLESGSSEALFISGSPGLGKTTTVHVLCNELGISMIEFNGSDLRNKKGLDKNVRSKLEGGSVLGIQRVIVMDEVDGMSSDRGGIAELIKIVKESSIPIICIANDRTHPKLRTLMSHCNEVKFRKPVISSVLPRLKSILKTEGKYLPENVLTEIVLGCNQDIRYVINTMQKNCDIKDVRQLIIDKKDVARNTFELASEIFKRMPVNRKIDLFFEDYALLPLFVHGRYNKADTFEYGRMKKNPSVTIEMCAQVSDDISFGDLIDAQIHGVSQNYSLLPYFGLFACVLSTRVAVGGRIDFPQYLGKMSSSRVVGNLLHGISLDSDLCLSDTQKYIEIFVKEACRLLENGCATECVDYIDQNGITRETLMNLFKYYKCDLENVDKKDKAAFTKEWNSRHKETRNKPVKSVEEAEKDSFVEE